MSTINGNHCGHLFKFQSDNSGVWIAITVILDEHLSRFLYVALTIPPSRRFRNEVNTRQKNEGRHSL